jgi:hypothetical protein
VRTGNSLRRGSFGRTDTTFFTDEDAGPVVYWAELHDHVGETYFADTEDAHAFSGELDPPYAGPSIAEMQSAFDLLTAKQQFVLSRRLGLAGDRISTRRPRSPRRWV